MKVHLHSLPCQPLNYCLSPFPLYPSNVIWKRTGKIHERIVTRDGRTKGETDFPLHNGLIKGQDGRGTMDCALILLPLPLRCLHYELSASLSFIFQG